MRQAGLYLRGERGGEGDEGEGGGSFPYLVSALTLRLDARAAKSHSLFSSAARRFRVSAVNTVSRCLSLSLARSATSTCVQCASVTVTVTVTTTATAAVAVAVAADVDGGGGLFFLPFFLSLSLFLVSRRILFLSFIQLAA